MGFETAQAQPEINQLRTELARSAEVQAELDRRIFHLKTLYDVSKDLFGSIDAETILRNGLLMAMGNFGVAEGLVATVDPASGGCRQFISMGFDPEEAAALRRGLEAVRGDGAPEGWGAAVEACLAGDGLPGGITLALPFAVEADCAGLLALGPKLVEED